MVAVLLYLSEAENIPGARNALKTDFIFLRGSIFYAQALTAVGGGSTARPRLQVQNKVAAFVNLPGEFCVCE